jgi:pantoate--beta-alanine ligase
LGAILEGEYRPDFFTGVTTIVLKLFQCIEPQVAIFGKKDYQQLLIIRKMCDQFFINTKIIAAETIRDKDGLALSSRNSYLNQVDREKAPFLYSCLVSASRKLHDLSLNNTLNYKAILEIEVTTEQNLLNKGWRTDYIKILRLDNLDNPTDLELTVKINLVILAASWLGSTRLIDNLEVSL